MTSLPSTEALTIGWRFSASHAALTKKLMKPSLTPLAFSNDSPSSLRIVDDFGEVDLVERGQHRDRVLRLHQALGDASAHARHRYTLFRTGARGRLGRRRRRRRRCGGGRRATLAVVDQVFLGHAAVAAGAGHLGRVDVLLGGDAQAGRESSSAPLAAACGAAAAGAAAGAGAAQRPARQRRRRLPR